uniref:ANK_REP_REGION domain-containing protein n=1 Tax=Globodera pallida TaxID=36090 RepID=A0A183CE96_GLOPA
MTSENGSAVTNNGQWLDENFPLHHAVFHNNVNHLQQLLEGPAGHDIIDRVDTHGNSALHIACMLGRRECIELLLNHGASIGAKNNLEWNCLHEAISYGDRNIQAIP